MLLEHMLACALIGLVTSGILVFIVDEGKSKVVMLFMLLFGATFGWIIGMVFIFLTGGLELSVPWLALPVITTVFASTLMLYKFRNIGAMFTRPRTEVSRLSAIFSVVIFFVLIGSLVVLAFPQGYDSSYNTQIFSAKDISREEGTIVPSASQLNRFTSVTSTGTIPITFDTAKSSVGFPRIAENPGEGDYLEFQLTFNVGSGGGDWEQPYIGMCVFNDDNGNGQLDSGEGIWNSLHYKGPTESGNWRANCVYDTAGSPVGEIFVVSVGGDLLLLPSFHASSITVWKTDSSYTFPNTPEQYTPPNDMISWEADNGYLTLKEQVTTFATVSAGGSVTFKGKIYCPDGSAGNHGLLVRAFDARYTGPYTPNEDHLAQHVMTFTVGNGAPPTPEIDITSTSWVTVALLALGTIGGAGVVISKGPELLKY